MLSKFILLNSPYRSRKTSISDDNVYPKFAFRAYNNAELFKNFRRSEEFVSVLEHVSKEQGDEYLTLSLSKGYFSVKEVMRLCDERVGNPIKHEFPEIGEACPTTLRYLKVLGDLKNYFRFSPDTIVTEIGIGYGGQARLIANELKPRAYNLIDLDEVLLLAQKFLSETTSYADFRYLAANDLQSISSDLVISNYAFSELTRETQDMYLNNIILNSNRGYFTYNKITPEYFKSYTVEEFAERIPNSVILPETPLTYEGNKLVIWDNS